MPLNTTASSVEEATTPEIEFIVEGGEAILNITVPGKSEAVVYWEAYPLEEVKEDDAMKESGKLYEGKVTFAKEELPAVRTLFVAFTVVNGQKSKLAKYEYVPVEDDEGDIDVEEPPLDDVVSEDPKEDPKEDPEKIDIAEELKALLAMLKNATLKKQHNLAVLETKARKVGTLEGDEWDTFKILATAHAELEAAAAEKDPEKIDIAKESQFDLANLVAEKDPEKIDIAKELKALLAMLENATLEKDKNLAVLETKARKVGTLEGDEWDIFKILATTHAELEAAAEKYKAK